MVSKYLLSFNASRWTRDTSFLTHELLPSSRKLWAASFDHASFGHRGETKMTSVSAWLPQQTCSKDPWTWPAAPRSILTSQVDGTSQSSQHCSYSNYLLSKCPGLNHSLTHFTPLSTFTVNVLENGHLSWLGQGPRYCKFLPGHAKTHVVSVLS